MNRAVERTALNLLVEAIDRAGVPHKVAAAELAVSDAQFSRLITGTQAMPLDALDLLPRSVVDAWLKKYAATRGLRVEAEDDLLCALTKATNALADVTRVIYSHANTNGLMLPAQAVAKPMRRVG
jgi:hypothetical protein